MGHRLWCSSWLRGLGDGGYVASGRRGGGRALVGRGPGGGAARAPDGVQGIGYRVHRQLGYTHQSHVACVSRVKDAKGRVGVCVRVHTRATVWDRVRTECST